MAETRFVTDGRCDFNMAPKVPSGGHKNLERKTKEQMQGRTNRRMPICNHTIQPVVVNLYTKYEVSILNSSGDIFEESDTELWKDV